MTRHARRLPHVVLELAMIAVAALFIAPFVILIKVALTKEQPAGDSGLGLSNFATAWSEAELGQALINSAVVAGLSVALLVAFGSAAAYVLARRGSRLSTALYLAVLLGLMIPLQLAMIPLYQLMNTLGLLQTYTSLIIFNTGTQLPFTIFLYASYIRALPGDFEEAAALDGAGPWRRFTRVVFPLLRPITVTVIILDLIDVWKDFLTPLLYTGGSPQQTLPVAIYSFRGEYTTEWGILFAGIIIAIIPVLIIYVGLQRFIINGFAGDIRG